MNRQQNALVRLSERALEWFLVGLFLLLFALVLAQIVLRYVFAAPLVWSEELARYVFVWVSLLGWTLASRHRSHIAIVFLLERLPRQARAAVRAVIQLAILAFALILVWYGIAIAERNLDVPTVTLFFNFALVYAAVPLSALMMAFYAVGELKDAVSAFRGGTERAPP